MLLSTSFLALVDVLCCILPSPVEHLSRDVDIPALDSANVDTPRFQITLAILTVSLARLASCWWASSACARSQRCPMSLVTRAILLAARSVEDASSAVFIPATSLVTLANALCLQSRAPSLAQKRARAAVTDAELLAMERNHAQKISLVKRLFLRAASAVI